MATERRRAGRFPLQLPVRLRLGPDLFCGTARDLSAGGIGLRLTPQPGTAQRLEQALTTHERGALELLFGEMRCVVRVRTAHWQAATQGHHLGTAFANGEEAARLIRRLAALRPVFERSEPGGLEPASKHSR